MVTDEALADLLPTVRWIARTFANSKKGLPRGINIDDLESAGNEAVMEARANYDPEKYTWLEYAKMVIRNRMKDVIRSAGRHASHTAPLDVPTPDGEYLPRADPSNNNPLDRAAARETMAVGVQTVTVKGVPGTFPAPEAVVAKVATLRDAMYSAVSAQDMADVMRTVVDSAKAGDVKFARLLIETLQPYRSGVHVNQTLVVAPGDAT